MVVWSCFPFIRSGPNHLARHSERGKKTRQIEEEVGRHHQGMDRPGVRQVPEGSGEQRKMDKTGCKIICGAPATLAVKRLMMRRRRRRRKTKSEIHFYFKRVAICSVLCIYTTLCGRQENIVMSVSRLPLLPHAPSILWLPRKKPWPNGLP